MQTLPRLGKRSSTRPPVTPRTLSVLDTTAATRMGTRSLAWRAFPRGRGAGRASTDCRRASVGRARRMEKRPRRPGADGTGVGFLVAIHRQTPGTQANHDGVMASNSTCLLFSWTGLKSCYSTCHIECLRSVHGALKVDENKN